MKKIIYVLGLVVALFCVSSCTKLDNSIVGKWEVVTIEAEVTYEGKSQKYTETFGAGEMVFEFVSGGTWMGYIYGEREATGFWSVNGNKLTLGSDGESVTADVITCSASSLVFKYSLVEIDEGITLSESATITCRKVN